MLSVSVSTSGPVPPIQYRMSWISDPFGPNDFIVYPEITIKKTFLNLSQFKCVCNEHYTFIAFFQYVSAL